MVKKILIVEDDEAIRVTLRELIKSEGYKVDDVENGRDALTYLNRTPREPCLVLLDLMMPEMTGWELMEILQDTDKVVELPIIIMTASSQAKKHPIAEKIVKKPLELQAVIDIVREYCGEPGSQCN